MADGAPFTEAARAAGRRAGDAVAHLVERFIEEGLAALVLSHGTIANHVEQIIMRLGLRNRRSARRCAHVQTEMEGSLQQREHPSSVGVQGWTIAANLPYGRW